VGDNVNFKANNVKYEYAIRRPMQVSLGCHVDGVAQPHPDMSDPLTAEAGARKRYVLQPPKPDPVKLARLRSFTENFVRSRLTPLSPDCDTSVKAWLDKTNYPLLRAQELLDNWMADGERINPRKDFKVKSFIKDETYPEYKHARIINSRSDKFKCAVGPIFRLIEEQVFKLPYFIKKIPIEKRPEYLRDMLYRVGAKYFWGDFTSFESHFTREILENIEFVLYDYMTQYLPEHDEFMRYCREVLAGENFCSFKYFTIACIARRMSGEMNTSLGNGFVNLVLLLFLFSELGEVVSPAVEGDDSNTSFMDKCPTQEMFAELGFTIKCGVSDNFEEMSFCGMIFDPVDLVNITDPVDCLSSFGWARSAYTGMSLRKHMALLRCKSMSYAHQYAGCPIVQALAWYGLRMTRSYDVRSFIKNDRSLGEWERAKYQESLEYFNKNSPDLKSGRCLPFKPVPHNTRLLCEKMYGISVCKQQEVEAYLEGLDRLQPLSGPVAELNFPQQFYDYYERYVARKSRFDPSLTNPDEHWPRLARWKPDFQPVREA
jgi:hypothetical protein